MSNPYRDKLLSVGYLSKGRTRPKVREFRTEESGIVKKTMDEAGHVVTQHSKGDRQDVHINAQTVEAKILGD